jgi:ubiquinone/menaquinone biosynthesis C-methylase UbiE
VTLLRRAHGAAERMDDPGVEPAVLQGALDHIVAVNRWLGARRALLRHLPWALPRRAEGRTARVLDVGTGSGDLPAAIVRWAEARGVPVVVAAVDLHPATLRVAGNRLAALDSVSLARADGLRLPFVDGAFDLAVTSMTLHHMDGDGLTGLLGELGRVARGGRVLVGELERSIPNYLGARLLAATLWRSNPVTRHDGPLSVLRSFTARELVELAESAGLKAATVHRHPFYRLVLRAEA